MEIFLRLKHWQVFMLMFGILMIALIMQFVLARILPDIEVISRVVALIAVGSTVANSCWMYVVGIRLAEMRPYDNLNEDWFKSGLVFQTVYSILQNIAFPYWSYEAATVNFILGMVSLGFGIYCAYFLAKTLRSVELDTDVAFDGYIGDFFLFLFDPIGVWWLQPRINKIFDEGEHAYDPDAPLDHHIKL